jgi:hypothetical protein
MVRDAAADAAESEARVNPCLMDTHSFCARVASVKIRDESQRRRDVECFADARERAEKQHLRICLRMTGQPRYGRPSEQTADYRPTAIEFIGNKSTDWAQKCIYPHKNSHQFSEIFVAGNAGNIGANRNANRGKHLSVEIIEQRHRPKQRHHDPCVKGNFIRAAVHRKMFTLLLGPRLSMLFIGSRPSEHLSMTAWANRLYKAICVNKWFVAGVRGLLDSGSVHVLPVKKRARTQKGTL